MASNSVRGLKLGLSRFPPDSDCERKRKKNRTSAKKTENSKLRKKSETKRKRRIQFCPLRNSFAYFTSRGCWCIYTFKKVRDPKVSISHKLSASNWCKEKNNNGLKNNNGPCEVMKTFVREFYTNLGGSMREKYLLWKTKSSNWSERCQRVFFTSGIFGCSQKFPGSTFFLKLTFFCEVFPAHAKFLYNPHFTAFLR